MSLLVPANDNDGVLVGSGNIFVDLGFDRDDAEKAMAALKEYHAKGGRSYQEFKAELLPTPPHTKDTP